MTEAEKLKKLKDAHDDKDKIEDLLKDYKPIPALELMEKLGLKSRLTFRNNYLQPALDAGLIAMTDPNNPKNRNQRYYKR